MNSLVHQRQQLRQQLRRQRQQLSPEQQQAAAQALTQHLLQHPAIARAQTIALYLANDGELDPGDFAVWALHQGKQLALPVLHPFSPGHMLFLRYHEHTTLTPNRFGIPEPMLDCQAVLPLASIDVLLLPLVGFDDQGNRLGMGGGFYDRTLAFSHAQQRGPYTIGLAHDCQHVPQLPLANWDIPVKEIITPTRHWP